MSIVAVPVPTEPHRSESIPPDSAHEASRQATQQAKATTTHEAPPEAPPEAPLEALRGATSAKVSDDRPEANRRGLVWVLGGITAIAPLSIDAYLPSMPTIERELGAARGQAELTLSAYFLGLAAAQLVWGPIADRFGRRRPLTIGLGLYVIGSLACALAPSLEALVAARFLQAVGGAAGIVVVRAVVRDVWSGRAAASVLSQIVLVMGAAPILAPLLGGAVLEVASWRAIFVGLALAGSLALLAALRLPETRGAPVSEGFFVGVRSAFGDRVFLTFTFAGGFAQAGMFAYIAGSPFVFIQWLGLSPSTYAIFFGANAAGYVAFSQLNRWLLRHGEPTSIARGAGLVLVLAATTLVLVTSDVFDFVPDGDAPNVLTVAVPLFVFVASLGLVASNAIASALEGQGARAGLASALLGTAQFTTSSIVSACVGIVAGLEVADGSAGTGRPMAFVMLGAATLCLLLIVMGRRAARRGIAVSERGV